MDAGLLMGGLGEQLHMIVQTIDDTHFDISMVNNHTRHRRRKILKVMGAKNLIAHRARAEMSRPRPLLLKPRPFLHDLVGHCTVSVKPGVS